MAKLFQYRPHIILLRSLFLGKQNCTFLVDPPIHHPELLDGGKTNHNTAHNAKKTPAKKHSSRQKGLPIIIFVHRLMLYVTQHCYVSIIDTPSSAFPLPLQLLVFPPVTISQPHLPHFSQNRGKTPCLLKRQKSSREKILTPPPSHML